MQVISLLFNEFNNRIKNGTNGDVYFEIENNGLGHWKLINPKKKNIRSVIEKYILKRNPNYQFEKFVIDTTTQFVFIMYKDKTECGLHDKLQYLVTAYKDLEINDEYEDFERMIICKDKESAYKKTDELRMRGFDYFDINIIHNSIMKEYRTIRKAIATSSNYDEVIEKLKEDGMTDGEIREIDRYIKKQFV